MNKLDMLAIGMVLMFAFTIAAIILSECHIIEEIRKNKDRQKPTTKPDTDPETTTFRKTI